jgi:hypothetical protein
MKKSKMILSAIAVVAIVGSALAFRPMGLGQIYCESTCEQKINWKLDDSGTETDPCEGLQEYRIDPNTHLCTAVSGKFIETQP